MLLLATVGVRLLAPGGMLVVTNYAASEGLQFAIESLSVAHEEILRRWASDPDSLSVKLKSCLRKFAGALQQWELRGKSSHATRSFSHLSDRVLPCIMAGRIVAMRVHVSSRNTRATFLSAFSTGSSLAAQDQAVRIAGGGGRGARPRGRRTGPGTRPGDGPQPAIQRGHGAASGVPHAHVGSTTGGRGQSRAAERGGPTLRAAAGVGGGKAPPQRTAAKCSRRRVDLVEPFLGLFCKLNLQRV